MGWALIFTKFLYGVNNPWSLCMKFIETINKFNSYCSQIFGGAKKLFRITSSLVISTFPILSLSTVDRNSIIYILTQSECL